MIASNPFNFEIIYYWIYAMNDQHNCTFQLWNNMWNYFNLFIIFKKWFWRKWNFYYLENINVGNGRFDEMIMDTYK